MPLFIPFLAVIALTSVVGVGMSNRDSHSELQKPPEFREVQPGDLEGLDTVESCVWVEGKAGKRYQDCRRQGTSVRRVR